MCWLPVTPAVACPGQVPPAPRDGLRLSLTAPWPCGLQSCLALRSGKGKARQGCRGRRMESGVRTGAGEPGTHAHAHTPPRPPHGLGWSSAPTCWLVFCPPPGRPRSQFARHRPLQPDAGGTGQVAPETCPVCPSSKSRSRPGTLALPHLQRRRCDAACSLRSLGMRWSQGTSKLKSWCQRIL